MITLFSYENLMKRDRECNCHWNMFTQLSGSLEVGVTSQRYPIPSFPKSSPLTKYLLGQAISL